ncbi:MAG TPA: trigger factor [Syntrophales bacterium]|nr:trigger factor [Syntrophales bacterium]
MKEKTGTVSEGNMMVTIEEINPVKKKLSFEIPWEETKRTLDDTYRKIGKTARVKGFRQGKIPRPVLERYYREYAEEETMNALFNRFFWEALKEHDLALLSSPEVDQQGIAANKSFTFSATVEVEPTFEPAGYLGMELEKEEVAVTESDIEARLAQLQEMYSTMEEATGAAEAARGQFVVIDFQGRLDGEPLKELKADDYLLEIGSRSFIPGFEEQLMGMKNGEQKEFTLTFPADYHHRAVAGKEVLFAVTVKGIKEKKLPELNEDFVKNFEQYNSMEELRAELVKEIERQKEAQSEAEMKSAIMNRLLEMNPFPAPASLVESQIRSMLSETSWRMAMQGVNPDQAAKLIPRYRDRYKEDADRFVRGLLILKKIAAKENITVAAEEIEDRIREMAARQGQSYEAYRQTMEKEGIIGEIEIELRNKKVMDLIEAHAVVRPRKRETAAGGEVM